MINHAGFPEVMAHAYHAPTTFCEVTYDTDWFEEDRHFTPYRYSLLRTDTDSNSDTVSLTLPSYTYYEYLRSLYDCRTTATPKYPPGYPAQSACSVGENSVRATTWHAFNKDASSEFSRQAIRSEPTRIRPTYPFPSLHLLQQGDLGNDLEDELAVRDRTKSKLVWVDALNRWVPESQLHPRPYISFVGNAPKIEKPVKLPKELCGGGEESIQHKLCDRFEAHMGRPTERSITPDRISNRQRNNEKREAARKKAQEIEEQRRQRKAYSTPLYTSLAERKLKVRANSGKAPQSTPVSPISQQHQQQQQAAQVKKEKIPIPREVWQPGEGHKEKPKIEPKPPTPARKEISITLMTPKPEEPEQIVDNSIDKPDKKVAFTEKKDIKAKKKTKKEEDEMDSDNKNAIYANEENDIKIIDALVKKRNDQKVDNQKQSEDNDSSVLNQKQEVLNKQGVLNDDQHYGKDGVRVYESTMNAAAKRRRGKTDVSKQKTSKVKTEKTEKLKKKKDTDKNGLDSLERLPITKPSEVELEPEPLPTSPEPKPELEPISRPDSAHRARRKSIIEQREIIKKERKERRCLKKEEEKSEKLPEIDRDVKKIDSWIYGDVDFSESQHNSRDLSRVPSIEPLPTLSADLNPEFIEKKAEAKEPQRKKVLAKLIATDGALKKWKKPGERDRSYQDELRRLELAEERRKKQMEMYGRLKSKRMGLFGELNEDGTPSFDDYGFLSKYCIFTQGNMDMYKHAFDAVDEDGMGWLEGQHVMIALRGANNKLTEAEEEYLYRVLELTGYKITHGADFKMFSVLAALSHKITALDKWMKNMIGGMDFKQLEMKMFKCKELWECNVDKDSNSITLDQLCVELRAGGVSFDHEREVREKLSHLTSLDLLDFLTYVPLFIMIHEAVVENPLSDSRTK